MSYLLDTNTVSETARTSPNAKVMEWFAGVPNDMLHISVLTLGEIRKGVGKARDPVRRERLERWLESTLPNWFGDRILAVDAAAADRWGQLMAAASRSVPIADSLIAATALHHDLRIVTRNERDFAHFPGLVVVNPWRP